MLVRTGDSVFRAAVSVGFLGSAGALLAADDPLPAEAASPDAGADIAATNQIVVTGERAYDDETLRKAVFDINLRDRKRLRPLARFNAPVCLHVAGLQPVAARTLQARIEQNVQSLGLALGKPGCRVNALVVSAFEPEEFIKGFRKVQPWAFTPRGNQLIRTALDRGDPAIVWSSASFFDFAGETLRGNRGQAVPLTTPSGAQIYFGVPGSVIEGTANPNPLRGILQFGLHRMNSAIVFDADRLSGFSVTQVADYATMHLLGELRPQANFASDQTHSILEMFTQRADNAAPSLTLLDRSYLHGIYAPDVNGPLRASQLERSVKVAYAKLLGVVCDDVPGCAESGLNEQAGT